MNPKFLLAVVISVALASSSRSAEANAASACNHLAFELLPQLVAPKENMAFSPYSIWSALTLASAGAEKKTLEEMQKVLDLTNGDSIYAAAGVWSRNLTALKNVDMRVANRLWVQSGITLSAPFSKIASEDFDSGVQTMDFAKAPEASLGEINGWVEEKTNHKISGLLQKDDVRSDTKLVLTNAVYFKARWLSPFLAHSTQKWAFHLETSNDVQVDMMSKHGQYLYAEADWGQVLRLEYLGGQTSMVVVLPSAGTKVASVLPKISGDGFAGLLKSLQNTDIVLQIPRFQSEVRLKLADNLQSLGMKRAFTNDAEFGRLTKDMPLKIDKVIHKAFVKVAEEGTEAAAATAITMMPAGAMAPKKQPKQFIADHPFLYFIMGDASGGILFAGVVMKPEWK